MPRPALSRLPLQPGGLLFVAGVVAVCTALCAVMEPYLDPANLVLVYTAGVALSAYRHGQVASLLALVSSVLVFDWIFVMPRWSLKPTNPQHYFTFAVMLVVGAFIGWLAQRHRQQAARALAEARRAQALQQLTERLVQARTRDAVAEALAGQALESTGLQATVAWQDDLRLLSAPRTGLALPLASTAHAFGTVQVNAPAGAAMSPEQRDLLEAFAAQASMALERNLFEDRSSEAQLQAEGERLRNTLLAAISHDFRTPLTTIIGATTSLIEQDARLDPSARTALLHSVLQESTRLHQQMSDLLDLTRLENGAVPLRPEWCPADELVTEALQAIGPRLARHRFALTGVDDALLWGDSRLLHRALVNLLDNAVRHTPPGTPVEIGVQVNTHEWQLQVRDRGPGLRPGAEADVFQKFHLGEAQRAGAGYGLGLPICAAVARLHGGRVEARSERGLAITLTLPQPPRPASDGDAG